MTGGNRIPSFPRRRESSNHIADTAGVVWTPAFAGVTDLRAKKSLPHTSRRKPSPNIYAKRAEVTIEESNRMLDTQLGGLSKKNRNNRVVFFAGDC